MGDKVSNPNPRYWRSPLIHYAVNFEKVAMIHLALHDGQALPQMLMAAALQGAMVTVCILVDARANAILLQTTPGDFRDLMDAYERWLSER